MKKYFISFSPVFLLAFVLTCAMLIPQISYAEVVSATCTGEILNDYNAAATCAQRAQTQATARGYSATCATEAVGYPTTIITSGQNYYYNTTCSINGVNGFSAYLLAGFDAPAGSNALIQHVPPGWNTLATELTHYQQNGDPGALGSTGNTIALTGGNANKSPAAMSQRILSISNNLITNALNSVGGTNSQSSILNSFTTSVPTSSDTALVSCSVFPVDLQQGDSGIYVHALTEALTKEGLLSAPQNSFDSTVLQAVINYQTKYKSTILTPAGLVTATGYVGPRTRSHLSTKYCTTITTTSPVTTNPEGSIVGGTIPAGSIGTSIAPDIGVASLGSMRYIRVTTRENGWISWREIEVYDSTGAKITISPSLVAASAVYSGTWQNPQIPPTVAANAIDGNPATVWNSGEVLPQCSAGSFIGCVGLARTASILIDLGNIKNVSKIRLLENGDSSGETSEISVSNDGVSYRVAARTTLQYKDSQWIEVGQGASTPIGVGPVGGGPVSLMPTITKINPESTQILTDVKITGTNFDQSGTEVFFNGYSQGKKIPQSDGSLILGIPDSLYTPCSTSGFACQPGAAFVIVPGTYQVFVRTMAGDSNVSFLRIY